jgi:hypothetical protein
MRDLQAAFDGQARRLTLRFGVMVAIGPGLILLELVVVALFAS